MSLGLQKGTYYVFRSTSRPPLGGVYIGEEDEGGVPYIRLEKPDTNRPQDQKIPLKDVIGKPHAIVGPLLDAELLFQGTNGTPNAQDVKVKIRQSEYERLAGSSGGKQATVKIFVLSNRDPQIADVFVSTQHQELFVHNRIARDESFPNVHLVSQIPPSGTFQKWDEIEIRI